MESERDELQGRVYVLERQLAQAARKEIDIERDSQDALAEAEEFRSASQHREQGLHAQLAEAKSEQDALSQALAAAEGSASTLQASNREHDQALQQKQAEVLAAQEKNRQLDQKVEQLQSFLQEQAASNKQARASIMELTRERGDLDMRAMRCENQLRQCQHAKQNADLGNDLLQKDVASLQQQLAEKSEAMRKQWIGSNAKVNDLEQQLRDANNQRQLLDTSHEQLQQQRDRITEELRQAQRECQETRAHLQQRQALSEEESNSLHTALARHKEERAVLEHDKQSLHSFVQELTRKAEAFNAEHEQTVGQLQQQLSAAKQGLAERDEIIQRFKEVTANDAMLSLPSSPSPNIMSAAQNGDSTAQAYSRYVALSHEHIKLQREHAKLQAEWEEFEQAVIPEAERAKQLAKRNLVLDEANVRLAAEAQVYNEKAKRCEANVYKWQGQYDDERGAHGVTRKLLKEAQHQVALLTNENRKLNGVRERAVMPAWSSGLLDQSLVQFKEVQGLVSANEHLRRTVHEQQLKAEHQLKQLQQEVKVREQQIVRSFEEPLASAHQKTAAAVAQMEILIQQRDDAQKAAREAQRPSTPSVAQQSSPQQMGRATELEQELSRVRQEGEAYRNDLKQQLEGAKQAAMQARYEAGQANAHAANGHSAVQQLQEDKRRLADINDTWKQQGREQQELISGLNKRLAQVQAQADHAQDEANSLRQQVATLSGQKDMLQRENQRLLHESTEHSTARWQLVAQRNAETGLQAQQQNQDAQDRAKLHSELNAAQKELAEAQRLLAEERSSHKHSFSTVQTVQAAADNRLNQVEQAKNKLQEALADAHSQLAVSEAKAATLQTSLQQAEARADALDQQRSSKARGTGARDEATEAAQTVAALRKELQQAQQEAAEEAGHVAQYKRLAEGAEETTKIVQAQYDALKAEAQQTASRLHQLESNLEATERDLNDARQSAFQAAQTATQDKQKAHSTITNLQAELVIARRHAGTNAERHQKTVQDLAVRTDDFKQAQTSYNKSVLDHAETVKKMSEQEGKMQELQTQQASLMASRDEGYTRKAEAELEWQQERMALQDSRAAAQRRLQDIEKVNHQLQAHLTRQGTAGQASDQDSQLIGLMQHLTQRTRTLEGENASFQQTINRLKADVEAANIRTTAAEQARIQASEQLKGMLRSREEQQRLMLQVQERSLVQESNMSLRNMSERYRSEAEASRQQVQQLQAELSPLRLRVNELQAAVDSHQEEIRIHDEAVQSYQKRISNLLHKADAVDKVEHERVTAALKAAQEQLATAQAETEQLKPLHATVAQLTLEAEAAQSRLAALQAELTSKQSNIEKNRVTVNAAQNLQKSLNPENLPTKDVISIFAHKQKHADEMQSRLTKFEQERGKLVADNEQQKKELAAKQNELAQAKQASAMAGVSKAEQQQQQAQLKALQDTEQILQAQLKALNQQMQQKSTRLEEANQQQRQRQEQLEKANADLRAQADQQEQANTQLASLKLQLDSVTIDLSAKSAQLETALRSIQSAQAQASASNAGEGQPSNEQQHSQELVQKELHLQQAQAAVQQGQNQLSHQQQQLDHQQQALAAAQQELQKREAEIEVRLDAVQAGGAGAEGPSTAELQQECQQLRSRVEELEQVVANSNSRIAELEEQVATSQATAKKMQAELTETQKKQQQSREQFQKARCMLLAKQEVQKALEYHVEDLSARLTEAGLPVLGKVDTTVLYKSHLDRIEAEKGIGPGSKRPAANVKSAKQSPVGVAVQRPRGPVQPAGAAGRAAAKEGSPAALASLQKAPEGSPDTTKPTSPRRHQGASLLKPRPSAPQGVKRERAGVQLAGDSITAGQEAASTGAASSLEGVLAAKRAKVDQPASVAALTLPIQPEAARASAPALLPPAAQPLTTVPPPAVPVTSAPAPSITAPSVVAASAPQPSLQLPVGTAPAISASVELLDQQHPQPMDLSAPQQSIQLDALAPAFVPAVVQPAAPLTEPLANQDAPNAEVAILQHGDAEIRVESATIATSMAAPLSASGAAADQAISAPDAGDAAPLLTSLQQQTSMVTTQAGPACPQAQAQVSSEPSEAPILPPAAAADVHQDAEEGEVADEGTGADAEEGASEENQTEVAASTAAPGQDDMTDGDTGAGTGQKRAAKAPIVWNPNAVAAENQGPGQQAAQGGRGQRGRIGGAAGRGGTAAGNSVRNAARSTNRGKGGGRGAR